MEQKHDGKEDKDEIISFMTSKYDSVGRQIFWPDMAEYLYFILSKQIEMFWEKPLADWFEENDIPAPIGEGKTELFVDGVIDPELAPNTSLFGRTDLLFDNLIVDYKLSWAPLSLDTKKKTQLYCYKTAVENVSLDEYKKKGVDITASSFTELNKDSKKYDGFVFINFRKPNSKVMKKDYLMEFLCIDDKKIKVNEMKAMIEDREEEFFVWLFSNKPLFTFHYISFDELGEDVIIDLIDSIQVCHAIHDKYEWARMVIDKPIQSDGKIDDLLDNIEF